MDAWKPHLLGQAVELFELRPAPQRGFEGIAVFVDCHGMQVQRRDRRQFDTVKFEVVAIQELETREWDTESADRIEHAEALDLELVQRMHQLLQLRPHTRQSS